MRILNKIKKYIMCAGGKQHNPSSVQENSDAIADEIRKAGGHVGQEFCVINSRIDMTTPFLIEIGNKVTITEARILTHDASLYHTLHYSRVGKVTIGNNVFLGKQSIVLPGTTIGDNVIIGAGAVVGKDIPSNSVVVGNPCKILCTYEDLLSRTQEEMKTLPVVDKYADEVNGDDCAKKSLLESGRGFIK